MLAVIFEKSQRQICLQAWIAVAGAPQKKHCRCNLNDLCAQAIATVKAERAERILPDRAGAAADVHRGTRKHTGPHGVLENPTRRVSILRTLNLEP